MLLRAPQHHRKVPVEGPSPPKTPHGPTSYPSPPPTPLSPAPAAAGPHWGSRWLWGNGHPAALTQPTPGSGCSGAFRAPPAAGTALGAAPRSNECPRGDGARRLRTWDEPPGSAPLPAPTARSSSQHPPHGSRIRSTSSSRLTHGKSPLIPSGIPSREKGERDVRPGGVRAGARGGQGHREADGKQGRAALPARRELTPVMSPPGRAVPFPAGGSRLQAERGAGGEGEGEEGSPGPAAPLLSPIFR